MPNELKPCRFCGGSPTIHGNFEHGFLISHTCASGWLSFRQAGNTEADVIDMWNRRTTTHSPAPAPIPTIPGHYGSYPPITLSGHTTPVNEADLAAGVRDVNERMSRTMHKAQEVFAHEEADDWGSLAMQIAEAVLLDLGIGYEDTKEPGADRRRDRLCRLIEPMLQPSDDGWQPIETAPKDGRTLRVRRVYKGEVIFEGLAAWRTVTFPAFMNGRYGFEPAYTDTGWMKPDKDKRFPEPTHWRPHPAPPKGDAP